MQKHELLVLQRNTVTASRVKVMRRWKGRRIRPYAHKAEQEQVDMYFRET
jgi:hypothetical protein